MLKKIGLALGVLLLGTIVVIALSPKDFRVARAATIAAPAPVIYELVSDFHAWDSWSPWAKLDPAMERTFSGAERGVGAIYEWSGNEQVGKGRMEIVDVRENAQVTVEIHFMKPFDALNRSVFTIDARSGETVLVTWAMTGEHRFLGKVFGLFMDFDALVGKDFELGLANIKKLAESSR